MPKTKEITLQKFEIDMTKLVGKIKESGFTPSCIVAIAKWGMIPAYYLARMFDVKIIVNWCMSSYMGVIQGNMKIHWLPQIPEHCRDVLIVDDLVDTGETMDIVRSNVRSMYSDKRVRYACMYVKWEEQARFVDYYTKIAEKNEWIEFFYE